MKKLLVLVLLLSVAWSSNAQHGEPGAEGEIEGEFATELNQDFFGFVNQQLGGQQAVRVPVIIRGLELEPDIPEYEGFDGWYNNPAAPSLGAVDSFMLRKAPSQYGDGTFTLAGQNRPNPRTISQTVLAGASGNASVAHRTVLLTFYGQQAVEELLDVQRPGCPPEYENVPIPRCDYLFDPGCTGTVAMPFLRSRYAQLSGQAANWPRQQLNEITPWMDGGLFYGFQKAWSDALRSFEGGRLAIFRHPVTGDEFPAVNELGLPLANPPNPADHYLKDARRFFMFGNPRANENPFVLSLAILWVREHNRQAGVFENRSIELNLRWTDERLFFETRRWIIALYQKITIEEFIPAFLGVPLSPYKGYNPYVDPGIADVFQTAAMRFGHTLLPPGVYRRNPNTGEIISPNYEYPTGAGGFLAYSLCNSFWNSPDYYRVWGEIDTIIFGMANQLTEREDNIIVDDVRGHVFGPLEFSRRDLMILNIMRGRDHGIADYNTVRKAYGLPRRDFLEINPIASSPDVNTIPISIFQDLQRIYNNDSNNIDIWVGGILETTPLGPGELFTAIIKDQFERIRDGDRFWYQNNLSRLYSEEELEEISLTTFKDVIIRNTNIPRDALQNDPFHAFNNGTDALRFGILPQLNSSDLEPCVPIQFFDYFASSESQLGGYWAAIGLFFLLTLFSVWMAHRREQAIASEDALVLNAKLNALSIQQSFNPSIPVPDDQEIIAAKTGQKALLIGAVVFSQLYGTVPVFIRVEAETGSKAEEKGAPVSFLQVLDAHKNLLLKIPLQSIPRLLVSQAPAVPPPSRRNTHAPTVHRLSQRSASASQRLVEVGASHLEQFSVIVPASGIDDIWLVFRNEISRESFLDMLQTNAPVRILTDNQVLIGHYLQDQVQDTKQKIRVIREMLGQTIKQILGKSRPILADEFANSNLMVRIGDLADALEVASSDVFVTHLFKLADTRHMGIINLTQLFEVVASIDNVPAKIGEFSSKELASSQGHARHSVAAARTFSTRTIEANHEDDDYPSSQAPNNAFNEKRGRWSRWRRYMRNYGPHVYIMILWFTTLFGVFFERFYTIAVEREHQGLRRAAGYSFAISRGSASVIMRNISILLLTVCYNTLTFLRNTWVAHYVPLQAAGKFHSAIGWNTFIFIWIHITAEAVSWYQMTTQPVDDLRCLFRELFYYTDELPGWIDWYLASYIGLTGTGLILLTILFYTFSWYRDKAFHTFLMVHKVSYLIYILLLLHGTAQIIQEPVFWAYLVGPGSIYVIDKTISAARHERFVKVISAELMTPSVTKIVFERPDGFGYKSGQYVKIACDVISEDAYHPFSLTSAAQEDVLSIHIRSVGDWTRRIRDVYHPENLKQIPGTIANVHGKRLNIVGSANPEESREGEWAIDYARSNHVYAYPIVVTLKTHELPFLRIDGPFASGQQLWDSFSTLVLVGEGIGVTPFASIIKDFIYRLRASGNNIAKSSIKKLYLVWVCDSDAEFEWFTDTVRKAELLDVNGALDVQIFRTDKIENSNLQGALLHLFESSFQKSNPNSVSPFTGLRGVVNFGKPDFFDLLRTIAGRHYGTHIGLFSAGQPKFNTFVNNAALEQNQFPSTKFHHYIENFW